MIDDPINGRKDADSITVRETLWDWYRADLHNRLKPGAAIILIQTRWHEDDLAGRTLPEDYDGRTGWVAGRDGERWFVVNLPAMAEADDALGRAVGAPLWPAWVTGEMLETEKIVQGPRNWAALYQQRPAPEEGNYFKKAWWRDRTASDVWIETLLDLMERWRPVAWADQHTWGDWPGRGRRDKLAPHGWMAG